MLIRVTTFNTPAGNLAFSAKAASASAEYGVSAAGLITTVHPAAIAAATFRVIIADGKFQGVNAPTTPTDCLIVTTRWPGAVPWAVYLQERIVSPANQSMKKAEGLEGAVSYFDGIMGSVFVPSGVG